jgi:hypothetical protein
LRYSFQNGERGIRRWQTESVLCIYQTITRMTTGRPAISLTRHNRMFRDQGELREADLSVTSRLN